MHKCSDWKDLANAALVRVAERGRSPSSSPSNAPTQRQAGVARPSPGPLQCQRWRRCPSGSAPSSPALALGYHVGLTGVAVVGGVEMRMQERALRGGAEIVVATPGRLLDHRRFGYADY